MILDSIINIKTNRNNKGATLIKLKSGVGIDINASTGEYVYTTPGTLFDDNLNQGHSLARRKFKKIPNSKKYIYYDVRQRVFHQLDTELTLEQLDSTHDKFFPVVYLDVDSNFRTLQLVLLRYDENFNLPNPPGTESGEISIYSSIAFSTEKNLEITGVNNNEIITRHPILSIFDLYIYDKGDLILSHIVFEGNKITLPQSVLPTTIVGEDGITTTTPALCEVTYGYYK